MGTPVGVAGMVVNRAAWGVTGGSFLILGAGVTPRQRRASSAFEGKDASAQWKKLSVYLGPVALASVGIDRSRDA